MRKKRKQVNLRKEHKSKTGGLTKKGRDKINRETGSKLKAPVTKKLSFNGTITGTSYSSTVGDLSTISVSFITNGAITSAL